MKMENLVPSEKTNIFGWVWKIALVFIFIWGLSFVFGTIGDTANVAKKEFGAEASLKKYEWFKDASNEIERKLIDINLYEQRAVQACINPSSSNCGIVQEQLFGLKSNYNSLVADYNSNSNKFNWSIYNVDNIPTQYKGK